jgi:hypothetical protein
MRLRLNLSGDWKILEHPRQRMAMIPGPQPSQPAVLVAWGPLFPGSAADPTILGQMLGIELGTGRLDVDPEEAKKTIDGWPYTEQSGRVVSNEKLAEERLAAVFRFAEWRGAVIARSFDPVRWMTALPVVRAAFAGATPDWRGDGEIMCIADLYEPVVD